MSVQYDRRNIQTDFLHVIADKKFLQGYSTLALMATANNEHERQMVAAVSLIDIDDQNIFNSMNRMEIGFVQQCHAIVRDFIMGSRGYLAGV